MKRRSILIFLVVACLTNACGWILYPERRSMNLTNGQLDTGVVILDAVGFLFGIVPGAVAFIVDFTNGTIYLPPGADPSLIFQPTQGSQSSSSHKSTRVAPEELEQQGWKAVKVNSADLDRDRMASVLSAYTDRTIQAEDLVLFSPDEMDEMNRVMSF